MESSLRSVLSTFGDRPPYPDQSESRNHTNEQATTSSLVLGNYTLPLICPFASYFENTTLPSLVLLSYVGIYPMSLLPVIGDILVVDQEDL